MLHFAHINQALYSMLQHVNTFTPNDVYYRHNRENLPLPLQMQLSVKPNASCCLFIAFLESTLNLEHFEKKIIDFEIRGYLNA